MNLQVLPLAITMMMGPQIMSAFIFVTTSRPVAVSLSYLAGVAVAATVGTSIAAGIASLFGGLHLGGSGPTAFTRVIQYVLVGLLIVMAISNWVGRKTAEPPKWLSALLTADPWKAFQTGLLLIFLMPSDIVIMLTVGFNLADNHLSITAAIPFLALTVLIAALPLLGYLLFRRRAERAMPVARDWLNTHSWLVNIIVSVVFIGLILG